METQASVEWTFMTIRPASFSDQIRRAVDRSDVSRYRISKEIGLAESTLSRFMGRKGGLSLDALDRLGEYLRLTVVAASQRGNGRKGR